MESIDKDLWPIVYDYLGRNAAHVMYIEWPIGIPINPTWALRAASICSDLQVFIQLSEKDSIVDTEIISNIIKYEHRQLFTYIQIPINSELTFDIICSLAFKLDRNHSLQFIYEVATQSVPTADHACDAAKYGSTKCMQLIHHLNIGSKINWRYVIQVAAAHDQLEIIQIINSCTNTKDQDYIFGFDDVIKQN